MVFNKVIILKQYFQTCVVIFEDGGPLEKVHVTKWYCPDLNAENGRLLWHNADELCLVQPDRKAHGKSWRGEFCIFANLHFTK